MEEDGGTKNPDDRMDDAVMATSAMAGAPSGGATLDPSSKQYSKNQSSTGANATSDTGAEEAVVAFAGDGANKFDSDDASGGATRKAGISPDPSSKHHSGNGAASVAASADLNLGPKNTSTGADVMDNIEIGGGNGVDADGVKDVGIDDGTKTTNGASLDGGTKTTSAAEDGGANGGGTNGAAALDGTTAGSGTKRNANLVDNFTKATLDSSTTGNTASVAVTTTGNGVNNLVAHTVGNDKDNGGNTMPTEADAGVGGYSGHDETPNGNAGTKDGHKAAPILAMPAGAKIPNHHHSPGVAAVSGANDAIASTSTSDAAPSVADADGVANEAKTATATGVAATGVAAAGGGAPLAATPAGAIGDISIEASGEDNLPNGTVGNGNGGNIVPTFTGEDLDAPTTTKGSGNDGADVGVEAASPKNLYSIFAARTPSKSPTLTPLGKTRAASTKVSTTVSALDRPATGKAAGHAAGATAGGVTGKSAGHVAKGIAQLSTPNTNSGHADYSIRDGYAVNSVVDAGLSGLGPRIDNDTSPNPTSARTSGDESQTLGKRGFQTPQKAPLPSHMQTTPTPTPTLGASGASAITRSGAGPSDAIGNVDTRANANDKSDIEPTSVDFQAPSSDAYNSALHGDDADLFQRAYEAGFRPKQFSPEITPAIFMQAMAAGYDHDTHVFMGGPAVFLQASQAGYNPTTHDGAGGPKVFLKAVAGCFDPTKNKCPTGIPPALARRPPRRPSHVQAAHL